LSHNFVPFTSSLIAAQSFLEKYFMKLKPALRKATELGIGLTALATLILAGCGGGGSSATSGGGTTTGTTTGVATTSLKVTPGKGIMTGANITILAADGTTVLGSAVTANTGTANAGTAAVSIPTSSTGPFIVSVSCPATCSYFDEKTKSTVSGSATAPAMLAVVPSAADLNVGVTAATNAAAQYAIAAGALTTASAIAANNIVIAKLGLTGVTNLLTPPTIISDAATLTAAQAGTTAADKLANYSASIAIAASGVSAIQAIADYGNAWKQAAITPASGVILPATINPVALVANAPTFTVTTIPNVASQITAATTAAASAVADVNSWIAEVSVAGNSNDWWENTYFANAAAAASGISTTDVHASRSNGTSTAANTYAFSGTDLKLVAGAYVTDTDPQVDYGLTASGWVQSPHGGTVVNNLDGTITVTPTGHPSTIEAIKRTNLAGTAIPCFNAKCTVGTLYPTGSVYTRSLAVVPKAIYHVSSGNIQFPTKVTDMTGVALTALPALGTSFCVQQGPGAAIFKPITPAPAAGADNYNEFGAWSCSATDIATAMVTPQGTVTLSAKATGNTAVPTVGLVTVTVAGSPISWMNNSIIAVRAGLVYPGWMQPAAQAGHIQGLNKIAVNAELTANGHATLP
jgi:hypothetical protein